MTVTAAYHQPIWLSTLEHYAYCERQCALMIVDGLWAENEHTIRGQRFHRRVDSGQPRKERGVQTLRGLRLWSEVYELAGRADAVEIRGETYLPVEFKAGTRHGRTAEIQLCAQALCLEEMFGVAVLEGAIWYGKHRRKQLVSIDRELRALTVATVEKVKLLRDRRQLPQAVNDERCEHCQLRPSCLPERVEISSMPASRYVSEFLGFVP